MRNTFALASVDTRTLSGVLIKPYVLKCHYYLGRYFLARYLKVRYLIDLKTSRSEVMGQFKNLKACLPFEQLMGCILKHKLWQLPEVVDSQAEICFICNQI